MVSTQCSSLSVCFFFQAEDGIRDLVRSRGLGDVYKRQMLIGLGTLPGMLYSLSVGRLTTGFEAINPTV